MNYLNFFLKLGFNPKTDFNSKTIVFGIGSPLSKKLENSVLFYKNPNNTNTSFYLITASLNEDEINEVRKYIWNKNDADIIFYYPSEAGKVEMLYAKYPPTTLSIDSVLEVFSTTQEDEEKLDQIRHWRFDSGAFWFNYHKYINKAKYKGIDKELVSTLEALKKQLDKELQKLIAEKGKRDEVIQALIDRTLYIKYLEDNHIINSYFYNHHFKDATLNYEKLLENNSAKKINKLFVFIHKIFNNSLFHTPKINESYLTFDVCNLIANSFKSDLKTGQLRLFDFRFDVLPVEFISYIYEVFLTEKQKKNGIYYTPKKLAQLIVDDVIIEDKIGAVLDPSCGSGMFLITGFQRLLEIAQKQGIEPENNIDKIRFRTKLLYENIFGIEKELTAQRFTLFSLSLQIFNGIDPIEIKEYIARQLKDNEKINLFSEYPFFENIQRANTLNVLEKPFEDKVFSYIVGNPPFFEIPNAADFQDEISFLNTHQVTIDDDTKKVAKSIVGKSQISQCFFLKIKDWSDENTRFGFVSNSSNFYNDYSEAFQKYFYTNYGIEKIYELSRVKKILFEKAKESVVAIIFTNNLEDSIIDYYPVDLGLFSEKPFELLIIQEDMVIGLVQSELVNKQIKLRDFLVGNDFDFNLYYKLNEQATLSNYILYTDGKPYIREGLKVVGEKAICKEYKISKEIWNKLDRQEQLAYYDKFRMENTSSSTTQEFLYEFLKPKDIDSFIKHQPQLFLKEDISNFERGRSPDIYVGDKIIFNRTGSRIKSIYSSRKIYFDFDLHVFKLNDEKLYDLVNAVLNSHLINYYIDLFLRKRLSGSYPKIGNDDILKIPIPKDLDQNLVSKISAMSKDLSERKYEYSEKEEELNELIYDLYELSYWEKQRVKDYFLPEKKIGKKKTILDKYKNTLNEIIGFYFRNSINIEISTMNFNLIVVKVSFDNNFNTPKSENVGHYLLNEIFEQNPNANFLASQEKIFGKDCVYIIKGDINKNWTETKAFEDGQDILKHLIPNENGERIH